MRAVPALLSSEVTRWAKVVQDANIKVDRTETI